MIAKPQPSYLPQRQGWGFMVQILSEKEDSDHMSDYSSFTSQEEFKGKRLRLYELDVEHSQTA